MAGPESSEPSEPQTISKTEDANVRGTQGAFNVGDKGEILANDATLNSGYGAGNPKHTADSEKNALKGCDGTQNSFNAGASGKINLAGATVNSGAFSGNGLPQLKVTMPIVTPAAVPKGRTVGYEGKLDDKGKH